MKTLCMTVQKEENDLHHSVFRSTRKRRAVLTDTTEIKALKEEVVQMKFYPCCTELYSLMFHLVKRTASKTTRNYLLRQDATAATDVENINTTVVKNCRVFTVPCTRDSDGMGADGQPLWIPIRVAKQVKKEVPKWYIQKCLYSRHMKGGFYARGKKVMLRPL